MKKTQHNLHDVLGAFVNEDHREEATRWLYPLLNLKGKKQAKEVWQDAGTSLTPETFDKVCNIVFELTNVDVRTNKNKNKETSFAQFLVSYALYYEFVTTKKITLNELCSKYMPWLKHSQILYAIHAIENKIEHTTLSNLLLPFANALNENNFFCVWQRLIQVKMQMRNVNVEVKNEVEQN
jgi:hypothetical protein